MKTEKPTGEKTAVIFRTWIAKPHTVIALFPLEPADSSGFLCQSYEYVGQHGGATPLLMRKGTRPSTPAEICDLACELRGLGYKLRSLKRFPSNAYQVRKSQVGK